MKFTNVLAFVGIAIIPAFAAPAVDAEVDVQNLEARDLSVYVCEGAEWTGRCVNYRPIFNLCTPFSAFGLTGYQSFGPGTGTTCLWYTGPSCTGTQSDYITNPGFSTVPGFWQFNTSSWKCYN